MGRRAPSIPGRLLLLHPAVFLVVVWTAAVAFWAAAPPSVIATTVTGTRSTSVHAFVYFAACIAAFVVASVGVALIMPGSPAKRNGPDTQATAAERALRQAATCLSGAVAMGGFVWFLRAGLLVGGPIQLLRDYSGGSAIALKLDVLGPAQLFPITTMVHLSPAAASLLVYLRQTRGWRRAERLEFASLILVTLVRATLFAERLAAMAVLSAGVVTFIICAARLNARRFLGWALVIILALWLVWTTGEFSRSWRDTRPAGESTTFTPANYLRSWSYSSNRLGAYVFTALDNGIIIINQWPTQVFPANTSPPLAAAGFPKVGRDAPDLFSSSLNPEFTGTTLFGSFYMDARDFGIVLAALFGVFFGFAWRAATLGSVAGIVLYAGTVQVIFDSYRMNYLFNTPGLAVIGGATVVFVAGLVARRREQADAPEASNATRWARFSSAVPALPRSHSRKGGGWPRNNLILKPQRTSRKQSS